MTITELTPGEKKAMGQDVSRDELERVLSGGGIGCGAVMACRLARTALSLHAQLADADMAQAALVERAVQEAHDSDNLIEAMAKIRRLSPDAGVKALAELRAAAKAANAHWLAKLDAEADRDRLAADNANLQARFEKLGPLLRAALSKVETDKYLWTPFWHDWAIKARTALAEDDMLVPALATREAWKGILPGGEG